MILADARVGSHELIARINKRGVKCEKDNLPYGDFMFEGSTDQGMKMIGIERKKLRDMLNCIDDGRYTGKQQVGMSKWFRYRFLIIEGIYKADKETLNLMEMYGPSFRPFLNGRYPVRFSKLFRFLLSAQLQGGAYVVHSSSDTQTVIIITELYHYFQKRWTDHKSMQAIHVPQIASFSTPTLLHEYLYRLSGLGQKYAADAERYFNRQGGTQAQKIKRFLDADEIEWMQIEGIGPKTAARIVKELHS